MVSSSKEARMAKKAAAGKDVKKSVVGRSKAGSANASGATSGATTPEEVTEGTSKKKMDEVRRLAEQLDAHGLSDRVTTGVLSSLKQYDILLPIKTVEY